MFSSCKQNTSLGTFCEYGSLGITRMHVEDSSYSDELAQIIVTMSLEERKGNARKHKSAYCLRLICWTTRVPPWVAVFVRTEFSKSQSRVRSEIISIFFLFSVFSELQNYDTELATPHPSEGSAGSRLGDMMAITKLMLILLERQ